MNIWIIFLLGEGQASGGDSMISFSVSLILPLVTARTGLIVEKFGSSVFSTPIELSREQASRLRENVHL